MNSIRLGFTLLALTASIGSRAIAVSWANASSARPVRQRNAFGSSMSTPNT